MLHAVNIINVPEKGFVNSRASARKHEKATWRLVTMLQWSPFYIFYLCLFSVLSIENKQVKVHHGFGK